MIANPKNLSEQLCNLSERLAVEMRALNRTKVSKVNGVVPDADGNVQIEVGGSSEDCLKTSGGTFDGSTVLKEAIPSMGLPETLGSEYVAEQGKGFRIKAGEGVVEEGVTTSKTLELLFDSINLRNDFHLDFGDGEVYEMPSTLSLGPAEAVLSTQTFDGFTNLIACTSESYVPQTSMGYVVTSVNGKYADFTGNVDIEAGGSYTLPKATSTTLGGVTIGSNISVSNGTISLTKGNVTSALGYTPLQNAPVTSVNGKTGAVTVNVGVTSVNGQTGDVTIEAGGGSDDAIPKTGDRGILNGTETSVRYGNTGFSSTPTLTINESSPDVMLAWLTTEITVEKGTESDITKSANGISWTKCVLLYGTSTVTLGGGWSWAGGSAPTLSTAGLLVLHWNSAFGVASFVSMM